MWAATPSTGGTSTACCTMCTAPTSFLPTGSRFGNFCAPLSGGRPTGGASVSGWSRRPTPCLFSQPCCAACWGRTAREPLRPCGGGIRGGKAPRYWSCFKTRTRCCGRRGSGYMIVTARHTTKSSGACAWRSCCRRWRPALRSTWRTGGIFGPSGFSSCRRMALTGCSSGCWSTPWD